MVHLCQLELLVGLMRGGKRSLRVERCSRPACVHRFFEGRALMKSIDICSLRPEFKQIYEAD